MEKKPKVQKNKSNIFIELNFMLINTSNIKKGAIMKIPPAVGIFIFVK